MCNPARTVPGQRCPFFSISLCKPGGRYEISAQTPKIFGRFTIAIAALALSACTGQTNVVSKVINSPLSAAGAVMALQFTGGSKSGKHRPTLALLRGANNLKSGDGSNYSFTVVVE